MLNGGIRDLLFTLLGTSRWLVIWVSVMCYRDGASTIQMYSSTITLNMHEYEYKYEYSENKCTIVRLHYNVLEYDYFRT